VAFKLEIKQQQLNALGGGRFRFAGVEGAALQWGGVESGFGNRG